MRAVFGLIVAFAIAALGYVGYTHTAPVSPFSRASAGVPQNSSDEPAGKSSVATSSSSPSVVTGSAATAPRSAAEAAILHGSGVDLTKLPLGDGKYTTTGPKKGYVYICHVMSGGQGAMVNGPWIHGSTWDLTQKVQVSGHVSWPQAYAHITLSGSTRTINTNDLPIDHTTGIFPIEASDPAAQYDRNQSSITAQNNSVSLPVSPTMLSTPDCINGVVGVMIDGVTLNDAFDALYRDAPAHEEQDSCQGHPNNEEGYHYHGLSTCISNTSVSSVIGWAYDGYPITGPRLPDGSELATADLDECHGMTSNVTIDGKTVESYHYVMTEDFPYSVSCFRGKSYEPRPGGAQASQQTQQSGSIQPQQGSVAPQPPQAALDACVGKSSGQSCQVSGGPTGICKTPPGQTALACVPQ